MEASRDGHWDWIVETDSFYASARRFEIYGFAPGTRFSGRQDFLDRFPFHPEDKPRWEDAASEHFADSEQRFDLVVAGSTDGIWDWNLMTDKMFLSEQAQRLYGLSPESTLRSRAEWRAITAFHPDDAPTHDEMIEGYLAGRRPDFDGEFRVLQPDGSYRWLRLR